MTMERFMLDGFQDAELYAELAASDMFPLVRELEFKYGLKVVRKSKVRVYNLATPKPSWLMAHKNGIAVGEVYTTMNGGEGKNKLEYCYRTPYYSKDRSKNYDEKHTVQSIKVSSLMATLTRRKVVQSSEDAALRMLSLCQSMPAVMRRGIGSSDKTNRFTSDEIHALLLMALGKSPNSEGVAVDLSKCQNTLDIYEAADKIAQVKRERILEMFEQPFFMANVDETGDFLIGKFKAKLVDVKGNGNNFDKSFREFETIEPFKRYHSYEEVPEFIPVMTMVKLAYEGKEGIKGMPVMDHYDENLQAVFYHHGYPSNYDCMGMVTPC